MKLVFVKPNPDPIKLTSEQEHILQTETGDIAVIRLAEMLGARTDDVLIAEEHYETTDA